MQYLELEITTTTINMNHDRHNDKLQNEIAKCYDKYYEYGVHTLSGSGEGKNKTKWADLTL